MRSALGLGVLMTFILYACAQAPRSSSRQEPSGEKAMEYVRAQVAFGPRPPGSPALEKCRTYLRQQLNSFGYEVDDDAFPAQTPYGRITMHNLIAHKGKGDRGIIALASHYDTKLMEGRNFVGANDGGSSTGLLLELARVLADSKDTMDYWFVFLDGEEALVEWSTFDSTYGSRHLAQRWKSEGIVPKVRALILLDMIGDKDLQVWYETSSTPRLMDLFWSTARQLGLGSILSDTKAAVGDDHTSFLDAGIPSVDIIDFNYGPENSYWHTPADTLDKISPQSLEKVGRVVVSMLPELQK